MAEPPQGIPVPGLDPTHEIDQAIFDLFRPYDVKTVALDPAQSLKALQGQRGDEDARGRPDALADNCPKPRDIRVRTLGQSRNRHTRDTQHFLECLAALRFLQFGSREQPCDATPDVACLKEERDH